ncbi:MAG: sulfotransferase [Candidatus Omnitrophica bacterium]|nr:sulfotransferase [Candidatus Omnitrophota bacterium]
MKNIFFIIGSVRSATTAVAKIFTNSTNSEIFIEQEPKLCIEARNLYKKAINKPMEVIKEVKERHIKSVIDRGLIYGDKNPNYLPFIPYIDNLWQPKFIFIVRDGRDVVRSMMDWHNISRGNIFGMREDEDGSKIISPEQDWWDYSRLRPNPDEFYFGQWRNMNRFEKCSWYWNEFNDQMLNYSSRLDKERWRLINVNTIKVSDFEAIFNFLGLRGFNLKKTEKIFASGINSPMDKAGVLKEFPDWLSWSDDQMKIFNKYAKDMMKKFGYY